MQRAEDQAEQVLALTRERVGKLDPYPPFAYQGVLRLDAVEACMAERLARVIGKAKGLPPDASLNHDHYLYGLPKK